MLASSTTSGTSSNAPFVKSFSSIATNASVPCAGRRRRVTRRSVARRYRPVVNADALRSGWPGTVFLAAAAGRMGMGWVVTGRFGRCFAGGQFQSLDSLLVGMPVPASPSALDSFADW